MGASGGGARGFLFLLAAASACNDQFDFDTALPDAGVPPIIEGGADDVASADDPLIEVPRIGPRIACGAFDCAFRCCSGTTSQSCIDVAEGGTCNGLVIQCDDTEDCPAGEVCCAEGDDRTLPSGNNVSDGADGRPERVHCETEAHCRAMNFVILCKHYRQSPCTECVATTLTGLPPGYHQCPASP